MLIEGLVWRWFKGRTVCSDRVGWVWEGGDRSARAPLLCALSSEGVLGAGYGGGVVVVVSGFRATHPILCHPLL